MRNYIIRRGQFDFSFDFGLHFGTTKEVYEVEFNESCWYEPIDKENDWNKLAGWTYGLLPVLHQPHFTAKSDFTIFGKDYVWAHHYNSVRIAWRPYSREKKQNQIGNPIIEKGVELVIYSYKNGIRLVSESFPHHIPLNTKVNLKLFFNDGLRFNESWSNRQIYYPEIMLPSWGYRLYPYFGGSNPAPHDMSLRLKRE